MKRLKLDSVMPNINVLLLLFVIITGLPLSGFGQINGPTNVVLGSTHIYEHNLDLTEYSDVDIKIKWSQSGGPIVYGNSIEITFTSAGNESLNLYVEIDNEGAIFTELKETIYIYVSDGGDDGNDGGDDGDDGGETVCNYNLDYGTVSIVPSEIEALVELYCLTNGDRWRYSWPVHRLGEGINLTPEFLENWYGVTLHPPDAYGIVYVASIELNENKLKGDISEWNAADLSHLETLSLYGNDIHGDLTGTWFIGSYLENPSLKYINLSANGYWDEKSEINYNLTGDISQWDLSIYDGIESIFFANNFFSGNMVDWLNNEKELNDFMELSLAENTSVTGNLSSWETTRQPNMKYINLSSTSVDGITSIMHDEFNDLAFLEYLNLSNTKIGGSIVDFEVDISTLQYLDLSENEGIYGILEDWEDPYYLPQIKEIHLNNTSITGWVKYFDLNRIPTLEVLNLCCISSSFGGPLQQWDFSDHPNMRWLDVGNNGFTDNDLSTWRFQDAFPNSLEYLGVYGNTSGFYGDLINIGIEDYPDLFVNIYNNNLTFEHIVPLFNKVAGSESQFGYSPQAYVGSPEVHELPYGSVFEEEALVDRNLDKNLYKQPLYRWSKSDIYTGVSEVFSIFTPYNFLYVDPYISLEDKGNYYYEIKHQDAPDLTLRSYYKTLNILEDCPMIDFDYYPSECGTIFEPEFEGEDPCKVVGYSWEFGDGTTSNDTSPFHVYGDLSISYQVRLTIYYDCDELCSLGQSSITKTISFDQNPVTELVSVNTELYEEVIGSSAGTFSSSWPIGYDDTDLQNRHPYFNGQAGIWRNKGAFAYREDRLTSPEVNVAKDGTYTLEQFSWGHSYLDAIPGWLRANTITEYSPYSSELENRDILENHSAALFGYGGQLPTAVGQNMRNNEMAYIGFEQLDDRGSLIIDDVSQQGMGNWVIAEGSEPAVSEKIDVWYGFGNWAIVKATQDKFETITEVDVMAYKLKYLSFLTDYSIAGDYIGHYSPVNIHCVYDTVIFGNEYTRLILDQVISDKLWSGEIWYYKTGESGTYSNIQESVAHTGNKSLRITNNKTFEQHYLALDQEKTYSISAWMSTDEPTLSEPVLATDAGIIIAFLDDDGNELSNTGILEPSGPIIEGWQKLEATFTYPTFAASMSVTFTSGSASTMYFDDLRLHPEKGNMQSYVYEPDTYRLLSTLDENNYASYYYYDAEGNLYLTKKETERGIRTIQESVSYLKKQVTE